MENFFNRLKLGFNSHMWHQDLHQEVCRDISDPIMVYGWKTTLGTRHGMIYTANEAIPTGAGVGYVLELPAIP